MKNRRIFILALSAVIFLAQPAWAGIYFESEIHSNIEPDVHKYQTYISGTKMKTLIDDSYGWMIDLKSGKLWDFDLKSKTYYEISLEEMSKQLDALGNQMKIFTQLYGTTDEEKKLAKDLADDPDDENRFGDDKQPLGKEPEKPFEPILKKVKKKKKLMNYNCSLVQVDLSPNEKQEYWITDQIPYAQEALNFWKAFYRFSSGPLKDFQPLKKHFEVMARLDGFALSRKTKIQAQGTEGAFEEEETVVFVEDRNLAKNTFDLPKDLKKIEDPLAARQSALPIQRKDSTL